MTTQTLADFQKANLTDDHVAEDLDPIRSGAVRAEYANTETISATKELVDGDCQFQILTASGSNQDVKLPAEVTTNHFYVIKNPSGATYDLVVKDDSGATAYCTLDAGEYALCIPGGGKWDVIYAGDISNSSIGWVKVSDTWTYASAATVTVPSDATTTYQKWMRVRFKQGGSYKYFVVQSLTSTVLTFITNTDYTVANAAITDVAYSFVEKPYGFPDEFNFTPSWTNLTVGSATVVAKLKVSARGLISGHVEVIFNSTSISGSVSISLPVPRGTYDGTSAFPAGNSRFIDTGTTSVDGMILMSGSSFTIYVFSASGTYLAPTAISSSVPHTWANTDILMFAFQYFG